MNRGAVAGNRVGAWSEFAALQAAAGAEGQAGSVADFLGFGGSRTYL